jgi:RimJ/RimL family protein N-acetyltransferase
MEQGGVALDPRSYAFAECLKDGTAVTIRAACPEDGPKVREVFDNLGSEARYSRFFTYKTDVRDDELARFTGADFERAVALVVFSGQGDHEVLIGGASYYVSDDNIPPRSAELAFIVTREYQGRGVASMLLRHLQRIARASGLERLSADVLSSNHAMLNVFRRSGLPMTLRVEGPETRVTLSLTG